MTFRFNARERFWRDFFSSNLEKKDPPIAAKLIRCCNFVWTGFVMTFVLEFVNGLKTMLKTLMFKIDSRS